jgi:hypothetical protein
LTWKSGQCAALRSSPPCSMVGSLVVGPSRLVLCLVLALMTGRDQTCLTFSPPHYINPQAAAPLSTCELWPSSSSPRLPRPPTHFSPTALAVCTPPTTDDLPVFECIASRTPAAKRAEPKAHHLHLSRPLARQIIPLDLFDPSQPDCCSLPTRPRAPTHPTTHRPSWPTRTPPAMNSIPSPC